MPEQTSMHRAVPYSNTSIQASNPLHTFVFRTFRFEKHVYTRSFGSYTREFRPIGATIRSHIYACAFCFMCICAALLQCTWILVMKFSIGLYTRPTRSTQCRQIIYRLAVYVCQNFKYHSLTFVNICFFFFVSVCFLLFWFNFYFNFENKNQKRNVIEVKAQRKQAKNSLTHTIQFRMRQEATHQIHIKRLILYDDFVFVAVHCWV